MTLILRDGDTRAVEPPLLVITAVARQLDLPESTVRYYRDRVGTYILHYWRRP